jgi:hypothetical protein
MIRTTVLATATAVVLGGLTLPPAFAAFRPGLSAHEVVPTKPCCRRAADGISLICDKVPIWTRIHQIGRSSGYVGRPHSLDDDL